MLPTDKQERKERPIASGVMSYFPDAIAEVAHVSFVGNQQHNPGQPMHWARHKSTDHADCVARHLLERGTIDDDGLRHSAKAAWRTLAMLQLEIEADKGYELTSDAYSRPETQMYNQIPVEFVPHIDPLDQYTIGVDLASKPETTPVDVPVDPAEALNNYLEARYPGRYETATEATIRIGAAEARVEQARHTYSYQQMRVANEIYHLGCKSKVADQIGLGTTFGTQFTPFPNKYVYIAGPMRGYEKFNFPAFDAARDSALQNGWNVISPADIDRHAGIKEDEHKNGDASTFDQRVFVYRDFFALYYIAHTGGGAIALLPGWEKSTGAVAEFFLARWLGLKILDARSGKTLHYAQVDDQALLKSMYKVLAPTVEY